MPTHHRHASVHVCAIYILWNLNQLKPAAPPVKTNIYAVEITIEITHLTSFQPIQSNYLTTLSPTREVADKHLHMMCKSSTS
jgi:hypothetical protein